MMESLLACIAISATKAREIFFKIGRIHYSMFDLPEADPPEADLLASGELDVRCLQSAGGGFDVHQFLI